MTTQEKLIAIYEQAEKRLFAIIQRKGAFASSSMYERTLLRQIQEELKRLKVQSAKTVSELVTENYQASLDSLVQDLQAMGVPIDVDATPAQLAMSRLNTRQIEMIAHNVSSDFTSAIDMIGRRTQDVIRNVTLEATAQKLSTGQTIQQMQKSLTEIFKAKNIMSVQYANGVNMPIKKYAEMTARSTTAEAQNKAQTTQGKEWGYDLVKMTTHSPTCPTCAMYQGRVYALTKEAANGKYKTRDGTVLHFPYLYETAFVRGYDTIHPNCRHRISIFPPQAYTSDELKAYSAKSTAPFEDTRSDRERKLYAERQAEKRRRNEERKQYERIRAALPDTAPKSFAGFVRMKHTNSQRYQELMSDYRYVKRATKLVDSPDEFSKNYKPVVLNENDTKNVVRKNSKFVAYKSENTVNPIYVSEGNKSIKPKELHQVDTKVTEVLKLMNISDSDKLPTIYVINSAEMSNNAVAAYRVSDNSLFIDSRFAIYKKDDPPEAVKGFACPNDDRSTFVHELFHWKDAQKFKNKFGEVTADNYNDYENFVQSIAKNKLDKLQAEGHNILVSDYARGQYDDGAFDETYAEYRVFQLLGGN
jgi:hypothetical protein